MAEYWRALSGVNHYADQDHLGGNNCQERGNHAAGKAGYSNDDNALRWEFGTDLEPEVSESARGSRADPADELEGLVESALSRELPDAGEQVGDRD